MRMDHEAAGGATRRRRSLAALLVPPFAAFLIGLAAMAWILSRWTTGAAWLGIAQPAPVPEPAPTTVSMVEAPPETLAAPQEPQRLVIDPEMTRRVNRLEEQIGQIDNQSRAAVGNADRAEGLLVAFAARRAIDRGVALGYLENLLGQRFGDTHRAAVATIITASRQPVTLAELQTGLDAVAPQLTGGGPNQNWWSAFRRELHGLVTVRREDAPSTMPAEQIKRARQRLDLGQVEVALAEVSRMPGRGAALGWIGLARRYIAARRALDTIETAALLEPHIRTGPVAAPVTAEPALPATPTTEPAPAPEGPAPAL